MEKYTDKRLRDLKTKEKRFKVYLGEGLLIEVMPSGKKYFRCKLKRRMQTVGEFPLITLLDAQIISKTLTEKAADTKFEDVAMQWFKKMTAEWCTAHAQKMQQRMEAYVLPCVGSKKLVDIKRKEIFRYFGKLESQGKIDTCRRAVGIISAIFDYAMICGECEMNPALGLGKAFRVKTVIERPALTKKDDIKRLMFSIFNYNGYASTKNLMLWTAYTFCRPSECRLARWEEIDGNIWTVPKGRMKMRVEQVVPLPRQCLDILKEMQEIKKSDYIFPSLRTTRPLTDNACLTALRTMGIEKHEHCMHGFRSTASTVLNELGFKFDVIEKALAHSGIDKVRAIYNRADYFEERKQMMQAYADWLDNL